MQKQPRTIPVWLAVMAALFLCAGAALQAVSRGVLGGRGAATWPRTPVTAMALHPLRPDLRLIATAGGLYRSEDGGRTWERPDAGQALPSAPDQLLFDPARAGRAYALGTFGLGVSDDSGLSWAVAAPPPDAQGYVGMALSPADGTLYIAASNGLLRSPDGATWTPLPLPDGLGALLDLAPHPHQSGVLYALTDDALIRSADSGAHWDAVLDAPDTGIGDALSLAVDGDGQLTAYTTAGGYVSGDDGRSWTAVDAMAGTTAGALDAVAAWGDDALERGLLPLLPEGDSVKAAAADQGARAGLVATDTGLYETLDGGAEWAPVAPEPTVAPSWAGTVSLVLGGAGAVCGTAWLTLHALASRRVRSRRATAAANRRASHALVLAAPAALASTGRDAIADADDAIADTASAAAASQPTVTVVASMPAVNIPVGAVAPLSAGPVLDDSTVALQPDQPGRESPGPAVVQDVGQLVRRLCVRTGLGLGPETDRDGLTGYVLDTSALRLSLPASLPLVAVSRPGADLPLDAARALAATLSTSSPFVLAVAPGASPEVVESAAGAGIVVLDGAALDAILGAADARAALSQEIQRRIDLTAVSPYVQSGPVPESMFFGREYELKAILRTLYDRSFAVVGGRKMGKTSLLHRVHRALLQSADFVPVYLDCHHVTDHATFLRALSLASGVPVESASLDVLRRVAMRLRSRPDKVSGMVVLELDEVDNLLRYDTEHGGQLFGVLHTLSQEGLCRAVYCGERTLEAFLSAPGSSFAAGCGSLRLGYLSPQEAERAVRLPLQELGVGLQDAERLPADIVAASGRHPNILQALCQLLIERVAERPDRVITAEDLEAVTRSVAFRDLFLEVSWGNCSTLERLVSVVMAHKEHVGPDQVNQALEAIGIRVPADELARALDGLALAALIVPRGPDYAFASGAFGRVLRETGLAQGFRESLAERWLEERS